MSFGLSRGRRLDPAPGEVLIADDQLGPLPDDLLTRPDAAWLDVPAWFERPDQPLHLEIGCGKGTFLVEQAGLAPDANFLGIEWAREFAVYSADRIRRRRAAGTHRNIRILNADAIPFLRWRVPTGSISEIHLYFSDPWPKKRHWKKRVIQDAFLADAHRVLAPRGMLHVVTDHDELWAWNLEHFDRWCSPTDREHPADGRHAHAFDLLGFIPPPGTRDGEIVGTNYERKKRPGKLAEGRDVHAATLRRTDAPTPTHEPTPDAADD